MWGSWCGISMNEVALRQEFNPAKARSTFATTGASLGQLQACSLAATHGSGRKFLQLKVPLVRIPDVINLPLLVLSLFERERDHLLLTCRGDGWWSAPLPGLLAFAD